MDEAKDIISDYRPGVLSKPQLKEIADLRVLHAPLLDEELEPAIDLHLGHEYYEMKGCIKGLAGQSYSMILDDDTFIKSKKVELESDKTVELERRHTYIFKLQEELNFHEPQIFNLHGRATGKSTVGRIDVLTRLITENSSSYDVVKHENPGTLYLEITPITFNIIVKPGVSLNQLRLFRGKPELSEINDEEIEQGYWGDVINDEKGIRKEEKVEYLKLNLEPDNIGGRKIIAFQATSDSKDPKEAIDMTRDFDNKENLLDPKLYWKPILKKDEKTIEIEKDKFYILRSKERFKLPEDVAVYCEAVSEEFGEMRIHYAGFVHPGFGSKESGRDDGIGTPLIFELRGHTLNTFLRDGETLAKIKYYRMSEPQEIGEQGYTRQELKLSKYFKAWH